MNFLKIKNPENRFQGYKTVFMLSSTEHEYINIYCIMLVKSEIKYCLNQLSMEFQLLIKTEILKNDLSTFKGCIYHANKC